jgi:hypothetical protein
VARLTDFIDNVSKVEGRMTAIGPFTSPEPGESIGAFIAEMERRMGSLFGELRGELRPGEAAAPELEAGGLPTGEIE